MRAGGDPGKPRAGGTARPCPHTVLEEERSSRQRLGQGGLHRQPPHAATGTLAMAFSGPCCVPQGQSLFVLHAAHGDQGSLLEGSSDTETNKHSVLL